MKLTLGEARSGFAYSTEAWQFGRRERTRDGLTRHGVAVEVVSDGLLQLVVR